MAGNTSTDILVAGAFAAFTVDLLVYPLDTLKTRFQSPDYNRLYLDKATNAVNKQVLFRGLYQGVGSVIIATLPSSGAFFTTYEGVKSTFSKYNPTFSGSPLLPQPIIHSAASSIAELVSCAILTPAEVIKQNAQMVDTAKGDKANATLQTIAKFRSNPLALWRGYTALAGRNLPFTALQFPIFERLKQGIKKHREDRGTRTNTLLENGLITAASAGSAGAFAAVVTTPVDVVKTRIMLAAASSAAEDQGKDTKSRSKSNAPVDAMGRSVQSKGEGVKNALQNSKEGLKDAIQNVAKPVSRKGSIQIAREIIADQGVIKGLFRGGALRAVWTLIGSGLYLGVYESGRVYLAQRRGEDIDDEDI